jgi:hypothetical protein
VLVKKKEEEVWFVDLIALHFSLLHFSLLILLIALLSVALLPIDSSYCIALLSIDSSD